MLSASFFIVMLSTVMLSFVYAECPFSKMTLNAECQIFIVMLSTVTLSVVMLCVIYVVFHSR